MKRTALIAILLLFSGFVYAQTGSQNRKMNTPNRMYDPNTVTTVKGTITALYPIGRGRNSVGMHFTLSTGTKSVDVHVGPSWYVNKQDIKLNVNDVVTVTGSQITVNDQPEIIASRIQKNAETLELRRQDGTPLWSARGGR